MLVKGADITDFTLNVHPDFKVLTELDMEWFQTSDGNYHAVDRGANGDVYGADITTYGTESYINNIVDQLQANREPRVGTIRMSEFASDEHIFGEDLDYSTEITGYFVDLDTRQQKSWRGFSLGLTLRVTSPTFSGTAALPDFSGAVCVQIGYDGDNSWDYNTYDTYYSNYYYLDHQNDAGLFKGQFNFTQGELRNLRRWLAINRDTSFTLSGLYGVSYPFGSREGALPSTVKIIDLKEKKRFGLDRWITELTIAKYY